MGKPFSVAFFGSSLVSSYWNGAATYYRGLLHALAQRGHRIVFYEPDAYERQSHRDMEDPEWARVVVYPATEDAALAALEDACGADLVVKASGVGVFDELLEREVLSLRSEATRVLFWDVDAPATLARLRENPDDPFLPLIPRYDLVLTYGGGPPVVQGYRSFGAADCVPIYNGLDPATHFPVPADQRFEAALSFLGNRLPDREERVEEFFLCTAQYLPKMRFLLAGSGWGDKPMPGNVAYIGHLGTGDHNRFNCTPKAVLNISRSSMAENGYSPATRVFEAAGAAACIITDNWEGIGEFFEPGEEILVADSGVEVAEILAKLSPGRAVQIGARAFARARRQHTYAQRAAQFEALFGSGSPAGAHFAGGAP